MKKIYLLLSALFISFSSYGYEKLLKDQTSNEINVEINDESNYSSYNFETKNHYVNYNDLNYQEIFSANNLENVKVVENVDGQIEIINLKRNVEMDDKLIKAINYHNNEINSDNFKNVDTIIVDGDVTMEPRLSMPVSLAARYTKICIWWWWGKCIKHLNILTGYSIITNNLSFAKTLAVVAVIGSSFSWIISIFNSFKGLAFDKKWYDDVINVISLYSQPVFQLFSSIPWWVAASIAVAMNYSYIMGGAGLFLAFSFLLDMVTPPLSHSINLVNSNRNFSLHYTLPMYYPHYSYR